MKIGDIVFEDGEKLTITKIERNQIGSKVVHYKGRNDNCGACLTEVWEEKEFPKLQFKYREIGVWRQAH